MGLRLIRADGKLLQLAQLALLSTAVTRGLDYLITPPWSSESLYYIEDAAPLWVWATLFISFGLLGLTGEWWIKFGDSHTRWIASYLAHSGLSALYFTFSVGALFEVFDRQPVHGVRTPIEWAAFALVHIVFIHRRDRV